MKVILFVGSNPSNASTCDIAFHASTKSSKILTGWIKDIQGTPVHINVSNQKTKDNRPLTKEEIASDLSRLTSDIKSLNPTKIVALGKTAAKALTLLGVAFYEMPHPSGRNRKLNDAAYVQQKIKELTTFCNGVSSDTNSN